MASTFKPQPRHKRVSTGIALGKKEPLRQARLYKGTLKTMQPCGILLTPGFSQGAGNEEETVALA
jgi:hypothetical protein